MTDSRPQPRFWGCMGADPEGSLSFRWHVLRRQQATLILRGLGWGAVLRVHCCPAIRPWLLDAPMFRMEAHRHKLRMMGISPMDNTQSEHLAWPEAVAITGQQWERGNTKLRVGGNRIFSKLELTSTSALTTQGCAGSYQHHHFCQAQYVASAGRRGLWWRNQASKRKEEEGKQMLPVGMGQLVGGGVTRSQVTVQQSSVPMEVTVTSRKESVRSQCLPQDAGDRVA